MVTKRRTALPAILLAIVLLCAPLIGCKAKEPEEKDRIMTDHAVYDGVELPNSLWQTPAYFFEEELDRTERQIKGKIRALYCRSDYDGEESYAFAYLGIPDGATEANKKPAVLLLHGGGGTAYWQWAAEWVNRGYVALAVDLEGHVPKKEGTSDNMPQDLYVPSRYAAPHNSNYADAEQPIERTWMYYAVSTAITGNSLLHGLPYVNRNKIGVCGVSWGGVITSIVTSYDDRFAFSAPIYCSLNLSASYGGNLTGYYKAHPAAKVWDTAEGLAARDTPLFLLAMNNDINAYPDSLSATVAACKNAQIALVRDWSHSHSAAFARPEPYAFADSVVNGGTGLIRVKDTPRGSSGKVRIEVPSGVTVKGAYIAYGNWNGVKLPAFEHKRLQAENGAIAYEITDVMRADCGGEVTHYYLWLIDSRGCVTSTTLAELSVGS